MRTTLVLDDDILRVVKPMAQARATSIGRIVSEMVRKGLYAAREPTAGEERNGFPVFRVRHDAKPVTLADVRSAEDEP